MRHLLIIAALFAMLPLLSTDKGKVEVRVGHYPSGQLEERAEAWIRGNEAPVYHGTIQRYSQEGVLVQDGAYKMGKMDGRWHFWSDDGVLEAEANYSDGSGQMTIFFPDGEKSNQGLVLEGTRYGVWTEWHPSGRVRAKGELVNGKMNGTWFLWSDEDNPSQQSAVFINGEYQQ